MLEPWNNKNLLPPPVQTCQSSRQNDNDSRYLKSICSNAVTILSKQSPLHKESALLSRFLYKYDKKFRNDIGYRIFKKINTALRRYLMLNVLKDVENFSMTLPKVEDRDQALPTRQMLQYVMVRLMSLSKVMLRISVCCKQAAVFYLDRVKRGDSHWMSLMPYALLSRIWSLSNILVQHSCRWYSQMYQFLNKLQMKGLPLLPENYELPVNLEEWLDLKNQEDFGRFNWSQKDKEIYSNLIEDDDEEGNTIDRLFMYINEVNKDNDEMEVKLQHDFDEIDNSEMNVPKKFVDKGQAISRENFKKFFVEPKVETKIKKDSYYHSIDRVSNVKTLVEFINKEESYRYEHGTLSLTNQLSFMQWQSLKKSLLSLCDCLGNDRKIQRKFLKIWKEKCIDCC
ncbi:uncharacterized protein [Battus philenor]|uniref:uncharacterized protein n=1 Tax=Battus philenor TaxID=42288 RepID=UPI0035D0E86B